MTVVATPGRSPKLAIPGLSVRRPLGGPVRVTAVLAAGAAAVAIVIAAALAPEARAFLHFGFGGVPASPSAASAIFISNVRLAAGAMVGGIVAQLVAAGGGGTSPRSERGPLPRTGFDDGARAFLSGVRVVCDAAIGLAVAANVALVGACFGAYGERMVGVVLPHGPFEVAAYGVALDAYLRARRGRMSGRAWAGATVAVVALLALAAVLETYGRLG